MKYLKKVSVFSSVFLFASICAIFVGSAVVNAAPSEDFEIDGYREYNIKRLPDLGRHLYMANREPNGAQGNYVPSLSFLVYAKSDETSVTVTLNNSSLSCGEFEVIRQYQVTNDDTAGWNPATVGDYSPAGVPCNNSGGDTVLTLSGNYFAPSQKFGDNYKTAKVYLRASPGESGTFSVSVGGAPLDGPKLGFIGARDPALIETKVISGKNYEYSEYAPSITLDGKTRREIEVVFAPPCDQTINNTRVRWKDADSGLAPNGNVNVTYKVYQKKEGQSKWSSELADGPGNAGSSKYNFYDSGPFDAIQKRSYKISFSDVSAEDNNTIQILLPFDQAGYSRPCKPPLDGDNWNAEWTSSFIRRDGWLSFYPDSSNVAILGDYAYPDDPNAPQPNQVFEYFNQARSNGGREITNLRYAKVCVSPGSHTPPAGNNCATYSATHGSPSVTDTHYQDYSDRYHRVNMEYDPPNTATGFTTVPPDYNDYLTNTQTVQVKKYTSSAPTGESLFDVGTGVFPNKTILTEAQSRTDGWTPNAGSGGTEYCVQAELSPSYGTSTILSNLDVYNDTAPNQGDHDNEKHTVRWVTGGTDTAALLCVRVPFYYNLIPSLTISSNGNGLTEIQQGDAVNVTGTVRDTSLGNGRQHTNSEAGKVKGVVEFVLAPNTAIPTIGAESMVGQEPCTWIGTKGVAVSASNCGRRGEVDAAVNANGTITINGGRTAAETENMAVGTKLCYATYINHPRHINNDDYNNGDSRWSYSPVQCKAIIKAPKVQFENGDVTVGRYRSDGQVHTVGGVTAACEPNVATSTIETTGAPSVVTPRANPHLYGSWAEYGAFAPGSISGFGTATRPFGIGMNDTNGAKRLMFSNTDDGQFSYGGQCLQNPFTAIKPDNITNLTTQTPQAFDSEGRLRLNELAEKYDASFDRTGYVSRGQNVDIAQPSSDIPVSQVRVSAKSKFATGNSGCPKLRIVASEGSTTDQDTKGVCSTSFETYTFAFHMNVAGPSNLNMQFVNDAWSAASPSQANRDLVIQSVEVNGVQVYNYSASSPGVSVLRTGTGSCDGSDGEGGLYLHADAVSAATGAYCYGLNVVNINAPVAEDPNHGPYNPLPAKTTITVSANALSSNTYGSGASTANGCPQLYMTVISKSGGTNRADVQSVCQNTSGWADYVFTTNVGSKGIDSIEVGYDPPDAYGSTGTRDLFVRNINVNGLDYPTTRTASIDLRSNPAYKQPTDASIPQCTSPVDRISMYAAQDSADTYHCVGVRISNVVNPPPPPPPASVLDGTYDRFKGRDIVIYSQKNNPGDSCSSSSSGNLRISQNIAYRKDGFANVNELPRIVLMADCNITIADNVTEVNATLIAGDAIKTCTNRAETISECNLSLRVNGSLSANRLLLWRTYGADLVDAGAAQIPAESFNLSPSQMIAGYSRGINSAKATTVYEIDLPPRY